MTEPRRGSLGESSKTDIAYLAIRGRIDRGLYTSGSRLVLDHLAPELGMSTQPLREALRRLEAEGLVEFVPNVGAIVPFIDALALVEAVETVIFVESEAIALSAPLLSALQLAEARALNDAMSADLAHRDVPTFAAHHRQFHLALTAPCPNAHLVGIVAAERARLSRLNLAVFALGPVGQHELAEHEQLLEMIERGADSERIRGFCRSHSATAVDALAKRRFIPRFAPPLAGMKGRR